MTIYILSCGCRLKKTELLFKNGTYRCPSHQGGRVLSIEKKCLDCGKTLTLSTRQAVTVRCQSCQAEKEREDRRLSKRRYHKRIKERSKAEKELQVGQVDLSLYTQGLAKYLPQNIQTGSLR